MTTLEQNQAETSPSLTENIDENIAENRDTIDLPNTKKRTRKKDIQTSENSAKVQKLFDQKEQLKKALQDLDKQIIAEIEAEKIKNKEAIIKIIEKSNLLNFSPEQWQNNIEAIKNIFIE